VASKTFVVKNCDLAPHDMAITENCVMLKVNALTMNQGAFISGLKGPAASLAMDGRAPVYAHIFPRPTAAKQFEPFQVELPACFSIHFSHAYEDEVTGNIVSFFSGWPPSDSKDFLGAWGGFAPDFTQISKTILWRLEVDPSTRTCVSMNVAPGSANACAEHPLVHPNFQTRPAKNVYASASNLVGDSSAPCGFTKHRVEDGKTETLLDGEKNTEIDAYFFGTRYFAGEPLIVPKHKGDLEDENQAYLLGVVQDSARDRSGVSIFDLERDLKEGPVCILWFKSSIPHGLHGCFALEGDSSTSVFC
jgi:carotenoid cleavage dioxygenase-like enzyme